MEMAPRLLKSTPLYTGVLFRCFGARCIRKNHKKEKEYV